MKKKVTVIVPVYNAEKYIDRCLESVINQTYQDLEILIVNDGSTDDTLLICEEFENKDTRIIIINLLSNYGLPYARDIGIKNSHGEFVVFVDADDELPLNSIEVRVNGIGDNDLLIANYTKINGNNTIRGFDDINTIVSEEEILNHLFLEYKYGYEGYRWNKLFRKSIILKSNYSYDEIKYNEDRLFVCAYLINCNTIRIIPDITYFYYVRNGSMMNQIEFNPLLLSGLKAFEVMKKLLKEKYKYAYGMCCLNAYYSADSILRAIRDKTENKKMLEKVRKYMKINISEIIFKSKVSFMKTMKVVFNEVKIIIAFK